MKRMIYRFLKKNAYWIGAAAFLSLLALSVLLDTPVRMINHAVARAAYVSQLRMLPLPKTPPPAGKNLILIVIDTLRADRLGCYGYGEGTSPCMDRLAAEGFRFRNALAPSSWTKPSVASLMTGLYPGRHGTVGGVELKQRPFDESGPGLWLREALGDRTRLPGSETVLHSAHPYRDHRSGPSKFHPVAGGDSPNRFTWRWRFSCVNVADLAAFSTFSCSCWCWCCWEHSSRCTGY